jgi:hypothetical protein
VREPDARPDRSTWIVLPVLVLAFALHIVALWGVPLNSDGNPLYRLQVSTIPGLPESVPYGLRVATGVPMGTWDACVEGYRSFFRFSCADVAAFRTIARLAGDNPDLWRLAYFALNGLSVGLTVLIARSLAVPGWLAALLALSLILRPLDVWTDTKAAESKGTAFLMLAIWLALRHRTVGQSALAAVAMLLAVFSKEPFLTAWVAVLGATLCRHLEVRGGTVTQALRSSWRPLLPHAVAMLAFAAFVAFMLLTYEVQSNYGTAALPPIDTRTFVASYWGAIQPALLMGYLAPLAAVAAVTVATLCARSPALPRNAIQRYRNAGLLVLLTGFAAAVVLHGAEYYLLRRMIGDHRYALPANFLLCLLIAVSVSPLYAAMEPWMRRVLVLLSSIAVIGTYFWHEWMPFDVATFARNEMLLLTSAAAAVAAVGAWCVAALRRSQVVSLAPACAAALALLLVPHIDATLDEAGRMRILENGWQAYLDDMLEQAPPDGHIVLVFDDAYMIENAWASEANTLLHGRLDLTYHLVVEDQSFYGSPVGINPFLTFAVDAFNQGRRPLPSDGQGTLVVRANRDGYRRSTQPRLRGIPAASLLLRSPVHFFHNRYIEGRMPAWAYEITGGK